jgi:hypothetical protein
MTGKLDQRAMFEAFLTPAGERPGKSGAGFEAIDVEPTRIYHAADATQSRRGSVVRRRDHQGIDGRIMSAFARACEPARAAKRCCGPACCS